MTRRTAKRRNAQTIELFDAQTAFILGALALTVLGVVFGL